MKLGIGTAQFGLDYGISNQEGKTSPEEVEKILEVAADNGIHIIDTASLYGTSEEALGKSLPPNHTFSIVTKTPQFLKDRITEEDVRLLEDTFYQSLAKLGQASIYGLMIHHADDLLSDNGQFLMGKMLELKQRGLVEKIGVSIYSDEQIDKILEKYVIDIIQLPINVLDQRLILSGHLQKLKEAQVEIHARSVFLQGLLLMNPDSLSSYFDSVREHLRAYHQAIDEVGISPVQAALGFVMGLDTIDFVVCGLNNHKQLLEICSKIRPLTTRDFTKFAIMDASIVNPSKWRVST